MNQFIRFNYEEFGGIKIYRPHNINERKVRLESEAYVRSSFKDGIYRNPEKINQIVLHLFDFYKQKFNKIILNLASRNLLEFVFCQFDQASIIESEFKKENLNEDENEKWNTLGPKVRRSIKFIAEKIVLFQQERIITLPEHLLPNLLDELWIAAEEMVNLYLTSDHSFLVFPEETSLEILPKEKSDISKDFIFVDFPKYNFKEVVMRDMRSNSSVIPEKNDFLANVDLHEEYIGSALNETLGMSYLEAMNLLAFTINNSLPASREGFQVLFINRSNLIEALHQSTGKSKSFIKIVLDGFTLKKTDLMIEVREIWKPKQEYRAFRRAFFEMPHPTGMHLAFSRRMAIESFNQLASGVVFKQFPIEWRSKKVNVALSNLSVEAGKWFEEIVRKELETFGIVGLKSVKKLGKNNYKLRIPSNIGEVDFLGYSEKQHFLLIVECKMVQGSFEGKFFRDDIKEFVTSRKSYVKKFSRKVKWLRSNLPVVIEALNSLSLYKKKIQVKQLVTVIITYSPNIAQYFIKDYPCVSITNFVLDYKKRGEWPYAKGRFIV